MAVFENIDKLKSQYTDKYVVVAVDRPELKRFHGLTGTVKTVNMSGRALVEFDGNNNIGWFDIDPMFLKVVDQPLPKPEEKPKKETKPAAKAEKAVPKAGATAPAKTSPAAVPAGKSVADILAAARGGGKSTVKVGPQEGANAPPIVASAPAAKGAVDPKKMSMADILAAARGGAKAEAATPAKPAAKQSTAELMEAAREKPAAEKPAKPAAPPAKVDPSKMSVADILAAARGKGSVSPPAASSPPAAPHAKVVPPEPVAEEAPTVGAASSSLVDEPAGTGKSMKDAFKTVAEIVAYCRKTDSK